MIAKESSPTVAQAGSIPGNSIPGISDTSRRNRCDFFTVKQLAHEMGISAGAARRWLGMLEDGGLKRYRRTPHCYVWSWTEFDAAVKHTDARP
jgi:hypothetical protein